MNPAAPTRLDEFAGLVGSDFIGTWRRIDPRRADQFYVGTYLDVSYGPTLGDGYPEGLVEGFQVLGLLDWLSAELIGRWDGFNYGLNRVRFVSPVTLADEVRLKLCIRSVDHREDGYLVTYDASVEVRGREKPGVVAQWLVLLMPKPPGAGV